VAHLENPYHLDDDDDAILAGALSQGLIWIDDDDDRHESNIEYLGLHNEIKVRTLSGHTNSVNRLVVNGDFVISASSDKTLRVWNWKTGQHLRTLSGHTDSVNGVVVNGDFVISASSDKTLRVWNWKTGQHLRTLSGYTQEVSELDIDGDIVVSASFGEIWIWNWKTGELLRKLTGWHLEPVRSAAVDGDFVLSISGNLQLVRNWKTGKNLYKRDLSHSSCPLVINRNFAVFHDNNIEVWDWKTDKCLDKSDLDKEDKDQIYKTVFLTPFELYVYGHKTDKWYLYSHNADSESSLTALFVEDHSHIIRGDCDGAIQVIRVDSSQQLLIVSKVTTGSIDTPSLEAETPDYVVEDITKPNPKNKQSHSRSADHKRQIAAKAVREYTTDDVLQAAHDFIQAQNEPWVNFSRVSQHLYERFYNFKPKHLGQPGKKYKSLLKFIADHPDKFQLRSEIDGQGVYWIRIV